MWMTDPVAKVRVENLSVCFGPVEALKNISLEVRSHEILTIIGPANSGKSTLLLAMNRMLERVAHASVSGRIYIDDADIARGVGAEEIRRRVGMVFAMPLALPMTIRENVLFGIKLRRSLSKSDAEALVEKSLRAAFLWDEVKERLHQPAQCLSGGQQQRLCLARTLAVGPEVIVYDEPCSGLDPISTAQVEEALKELKQQHTQVLVTNNTKQAARVGDRTAFLLTGELVELGDTEQIFTCPTDERTEQYVTGKVG